MIIVELTGVKEAMAELDPEKVRKAARSALNRAADQGRTQASRAIREEYNISAGEVNKQLRVTSRAGADDTSVVISGTGRGLPLAVFAAKQEGVKANKKGIRYTRRAKMAGTIVGAPGLFRAGIAGGQVTVQVKKTSGRKPVTTDPKAFLARFKTGHLAVARRTGKDRKPIKELWGPGIGLLFGSKGIMEPLKTFIADKFEQLFDRELKWRA